jgi:hypothetical protein
VVLPAFVLSGLTAARGKRSGAFFVAPWLVFSTLMGTSIVVTMALMAAEGFGGTAPAATALSVVVVASCSAAWRYLHGVTDQDDLQLEASSILTVTLTD